jgi:WD40-like Beta Propeller Repeat
MKIFNSGSVPSAIALLLIFGVAGPDLAAGKGGGKKPPPQPTPADPAIAYVVGNSSTGTWGDMMAMDADGSNQTVVVSGEVTRPVSPSWSPDGRHLVYSHLFNGACSGLHVVSLLDAFGTWSTPKTVGCILGWAPKWKPDDGSGINTILFEASQEMYGGPPERTDGDIFMVKFGLAPDGSIVNVLAPSLFYTGAPEVDEGGMAWSGDGSQIAFVETDFTLSPYTQDVKVLDGNTGIAQSVIPPSSVLNGAYFSYSVSWARTKGLLIVEAGPSWTSDKDLWCIDVDNNSNQPVNLTAEFDLQYGEASDTSPSWSPNDSEIVFSRNGVTMVLRNVVITNGCPDPSTLDLVEIAKARGKGKTLGGFDWRRN